MDVRTPTLGFEISYPSFAPKPFDVNRLQKKDVVKLCPGTELLNIQLTKVVGEMCEGNVINTPIFTHHGLSKGDLVRFQKKNIFAIVEKWID